MPPVIKYSKDKIIEVSLNLVKERGIESVSARSIAKELGCSICPVFSCFESMDSLKKEILDNIYEVYIKYVQDSMKRCDKPFKGAGIGYIKFAKEYKNYFKALFMNNLNGDLSSFISLDSNNEEMQKNIAASYNISKENARKIHEYCWVFVHGIAVMVATDYCNFEDEQISEMLSFEYMSLLEKIKKEN